MVPHHGDSVASKHVRSLTKSLFRPVVLDLMHVHNFHSSLVNFVKVVVFLVWAIVHQGILTIEKKYPISRRRANRCIS